MVLTWNQCAIYANEESIWIDTLSKDPRSWIANNNLGNIYLLRGEVARAIPFYEESLKVKADHPEAHMNLGLALQRLGNMTGARDHISTALTLNPDLLTRRPKTATSPRP
jgi:tetratricopeptide (TPR) repeat protein